MTKPNVFLVSDTHFGHKGVCNFLRRDGVTKLRPWNDPDEMDEELVSRWNAKVKPNDFVYHLGDVVINRKALKTLSRLNGIKTLIKGNHDIFKIHEYTEYFKDVRSCHPLMNQYILTHIPLHPGSLGRWGMNIHGHLHADVVLDENGQPDQRYLCVCVEHTDFAPIELSELNDLIKKQHNWNI